MTTDSNATPETRLARLTRLSEDEDALAAIATLVLLGYTASAVERAMQRLDEREAAQP